MENGLQQISVGLGFSRFRDIGSHPGSQRWILGIEIQGFKGVFFGPKGQRCGLNAESPHAASEFQELGL